MFQKDGNVPWHNQSQEKEQTWKCSSFNPKVKTWNYLEVRTGVSGCCQWEIVENSHLMTRVSSYPIDLSMYLITYFKRNQLVCGFLG